MFAQLRKSATITEKLTPMIQGLEAIEPLRIGTKNFLNAWSLRGNLTGQAGPCCRIIFFTNYGDLPEDPYSP
jgi:hypothetical protein